MTRFTIGFDKRDAPVLHRLWDEVIASERWTEGPFTKQFEEAWSAYGDFPSVAFSSWSGAALAALEYFKVRGKTVLCPSNTFMATPLVTLQAGARVEFVDCNRTDLCLSLADLTRKVEEFRPAAVWLVHIGGHIAFETEEIAAFCEQRGVVLLEDCAHAHGAQWHGKRAGAWGDAGVYSFYGTKTISTGEGGMLVTRDADLVEFARLYRNYGKPQHVVHGLNHRMSEFVAAIGVVQTRRLPDIIDFKQNLAAKLDTQFSNRVRLPDGMVSGYYKYIVFDEIPNSTGKVYDAPCHRILNHSVDLPDTDWVASHHWCVPIYYQTPAD